MTLIIFGDWLDFARLEFHMDIPHTDDRLPDLDVEGFWVDIAMEAVK